MPADPTPPRLPDNTLSDRYRADNSGWHLVSKRTGLSIQIRLSEWFKAEYVEQLRAELTATRLALSTLQKEHEDLKARVGGERRLEGQDLPRLSKGDTSMSARVGDGVDLISEERTRQLTIEGWTPAHDDSHDDGSLAAAASCLAAEGTDAEFTWPNYELSWIKSLRDKHATSDRVRQLVIAGALIAAEIDRLQRREGGT